MRIQLYLGLLPLLLVSQAIASQAAFARLSVLTTTSDLGAVAEEIAGPDADTEALCKGSQDPHFLEAKPSYMVKANKADLVVAVGLELEVGWLPPILQGARNPRIMPGQKGYLEVGPLVETLEMPSGKISRAEGDVHPDGNPHITLDPVRTGQIALKVAGRMGELDPGHAVAYQSRAESLKKRLDEKAQGWKTRVAKTGVTKVVTFHKTFSYFLDRFGMKAVANLEPLPGVPPTAKHVLEVIQTAREQKVPLIMVENFFDASVAERVAKDTGGIRVVTVPVAVGGDESVKTLDDLYEHLVRVVEGASS